MPLNHNATKCYIMLNKIDAEEFVKINSKLLLLLLFRPLFLCLFCVTNLLPLKASPSATKNDVPKFGLFRDLHLTPITLLITQLLQKKSSAISLQTQYEDK